MVYFTGDTHGDIASFMKRIRKYPLTSSDTLIVAGDFGFSWDISVTNSWMRLEKPCRVLFCDGNHENYTRMRKMETTSLYGDIVGVFGNDTYRLLTGHMYTIEGEKLFVFGGASSIDKDMRTDPGMVALYGKTWWEEEVPSYKTMDEALGTLERNNWTFSWFLTHTTRPEIKEEILDSTIAFFDPVESMLRAIDEEIEKHDGSYKAWYFGHFHKDYVSNHRYCLYNDIVKAE